MKFKLCLFLICCLSLNFASAQKAKTEEGLQGRFQDFVPIEPMNYIGTVEIADLESGGLSYKYIKLLSIKELLQYLSNETVLVSVAEVEAKGGMRYTQSRTSQKGMQYLITMDYVKFSTIELKRDNEILGEACVGIGLRVSLNISTKAKDINLGDIFALGMAVKERQAYGSMRLSSLGLHSEEITAVLPLPGEVSGAAIQSMMQVLATIKHKMYDGKAGFSPQILALRPLKEGLSLEELNSLLLQQQAEQKKNAPTPR